ncbi:MAG: polysaccharide deacetylase family protein [Proteobacteria bacterium]|nr:polysaccharide deacetylase family protein [Pseudomonadota bacterium]
MNHYLLRKRASLYALMALTALLGAAGAGAAPCPPGALGTHRVQVVAPDPAARFGLKSYDKTLPLGEKEVVLTFDDGPLPGPTDAVLAALEKECVRATFFLIGRNAKAAPHLARRIAEAGHTLANHSMTHPWTMRQMDHDAAWRNIMEGQAAIESAAGKRIAPFFRFPGFADTPALLESLAGAGIVVMGTDIWASDWNVMSPERQLRLTMRRLERAGSGIVLFHDTKSQTAAMLPAFLRALAEGGWRVVHIVGP